MRNVEWSKQFRWQRFVNDSTVTIPPFGCVCLPFRNSDSFATKVARVVDGEAVLSGRLATDEDVRLAEPAFMLFNGPTEVAPDSFGLGTQDFPCVAARRFDQGVYDHGRVSQFTDGETASLQGGPVAGETVLGMGRSFRDVGSIGPVSVGACRVSLVSPCYRPFNRQRFEGREDIPGEMSICDGRIGSSVFTDGGYTDDPVDFGYGQRLEFTQPIPDYSEALAFDTGSYYGQSLLRPRVYESPDETNHPPATIFTRDGLYWVDVTTALRSVVESSATPIPIRVRVALINSEGEEFHQLFSRDMVSGHSVLDWSPRTYAVYSPHRFCGLVAAKAGWEIKILCSSPSPDVETIDAVLASWSIWQCGEFPASSDLEYLELA